jgi:hypothetical protein
MQHGFGGSCDCGDETTLPLTSFCENHKGFQRSDFRKEMDKIPNDIQ